MKIEVLYSEVANLYGDLFNIKYLEKALPDAKIYYTNLNDKPQFVDQDIDLIYMGPMMERYQEKVIEKLKPYTNRIKQLIENDKVFLITGNALEIFGSKIDNVEGLGIFETYAKRDFTHHHNSCFIGQYMNMKIVGFKSQFSYSYNNKNPFIKVINGFGFNDDNTIEGIKYHNFFGTYLIGPILILNPYFTKYLLDLLGKDIALPYMDNLLKAYEIRKEEYLDKSLDFTKIH